VVAQQIMNKNVFEPQDYDLMGLRSIDYHFPMGIWW